MRDTGYRILADGVTASNDTWATGLANHDLIIGPTGGGKTRGYVLPNLLSSQESFIATDGKGTLRRQVGGILERRGFRVLELDFTDLLRSPWGYNPLRFIRYDMERERWTSRTSSLSPPRWCQSRTKLSHFGSMPRGICWRPLSATRWSACRWKNIPLPAWQDYSPRRRQGFLMN